MQTSALDMVRARAMDALGKARDAQAKAIARARLIRDSARFGSREYHDANAVVEDVEQIGRLLDSVGGAVAAPVGVGGAAQPPKGYTTPPSAPAMQAGPTGSPDRVLGSILRTLLTGLCGDPNCQMCKGAFGGTTPPAAAANGVGVTDRAG